MFFLCYMSSGENEQNEQEINSAKTTTATASSGNKMPVVISCLPTSMTITNTNANRAASVLSSSTTASSTDEGGFNEPSPEIKAKLKPVYQFDIQSPPLPPSPPARNVIPPPLPPNDTNLESPVSLNYVDVVSHTSNVVNGRTSSVVSDKTLYASIKPEVPSPPEMLLEAEVKLEAQLLDIDDTSSDTQVILTRESSFIPMKAEFDPADDSSIGETDGYVSEKPLPQLPCLDLQDMEYVDASEPEEEANVNVDAMTADEAEKLLSSK